MSEGKYFSKSERQRFRPYPKYKASGVEWLGEIPEQWKFKRLKFLISEPLAYGANEAAELIDPDLPRFIRITDIRDDGRLRDDTFRSLPREIAIPHLLKDGDLLFARSGATVGKAFRYNSVWGTAAHAGYLIRARLDKFRIDSYFVHYFTQSDSYWNWIRSSLIQATIQNVSAERYSNLVIPVPVLDRQRSIVSFLDRETAKIDALIEKKERLIDLLQEKRTALITQVVTKGLDPNVPIKNSGVEWLGQIPAHWKAKRLKQVVPQITVGIVVTPSKYYVDDGISCLRSLNIAKGRIENAELVFISQAANEFHRKSQIFNGDVVVVRTGKAGTAVVVSPEFDGANCIDLLIIRKSEKFDSRFLYYFINSGITSVQVEVNSVGAIQEHYNTGTLAELYVPCVPLKEQRTIVAFLDRETAKIDTLVAKTHEAIDRLKEYRTALISAAVTGKIHVQSGIQ
jgi:type I restriction enzyme S subunit